MSEPAFVPTAIVPEKIYGVMSLLPDGMVPTTTPRKTYHVVPIGQIADAIVKLIAGSFPNHSQPMWAAKAEIIDTPDPLGNKNFTLRVVWRNSIHNSLLHVTEVSRINGAITFADAFGSYSASTCTYRLLGYPQTYISP